MVSDTEVKLLGAWPSPFVLRVKAAFNLKGVKYEFVEEEFGDFSELLLKSNPVHKKIPVLLHGGKPICESLVIVNYIDDAWPSSSPSLLPADPYDRAIARFWAAYIDDKWFPAMRGVVLGQTMEAKAEGTEQLGLGLGLLEEAFDKCSKGKGFFGGDTIGYLDIALGSLLGWLKVAEKTSGIVFLDQEKAPLLVGWAARFCSDDAVKELMPETDRLVEFGNVLLARLAAAAASTSN